MKSGVLNDPVSFERDGVEEPQRGSFQCLTDERASATARLELFERHSQAR